MSERLVFIRVGWGEPTDDGDFIFNFHINMGRTSWREMTDYNSLAALNVVFHRSGEEFTKTLFPHFGKNESEFVVASMEHAVYKKETIHFFETKRIAMEIWINTLTNNISRISVEARMLCRNLLFSSSENTARFDGWMRTLGIFEGSLCSIDEGDESEHRHSHYMFNILNGRLGSGHTTQPPVLSQRNLEKTAKKKDFLRANVAGTATVHSDTQTTTSLAKFSSIFMHKAKSAMSDGETAKSQTQELHNHLPQKQHLESGDAAAIEAISAHNKVQVVMTTSVQRSEETQSGVHVYVIYLRVQGKVNTPVVYRVFQRYNIFKRLWHRLQEINNEISAPSSSSPRSLSLGLGAATTGSKAAPYADFIKQITAPFPASPVKSYLGISLNEAELAERTRMLDAWLRDVCYFYRDMPATAREEIRRFLNFNMKTNKDIFVHDQLAWGMIEPNKVKDSAVLILRASTIVNLHDSELDTSADVAARGDGTVNGANGDGESAARGGGMSKQKSIRYNLKESSNLDGVSRRGEVPPFFLAKSASTRTVGSVAVDVKSMNGSILRSAGSKRASSVA